MSNLFAVIFAALIVAAVSVDHYLNQGLASLFLLRKAADFVEYLSFWR
ncbi:MAG: hypothetical protein V9G14_09050 [Cypionkella sp.]